MPHPYAIRLTFRILSFLHTQCMHHKKSNGIPYIKFNQVASVVIDSIEGNFRGKKPSQIFIIYQPPTKVLLDENLGMPHLFMQSV